MATVLLIITIPTELEEQRKRQEQLSRKQDVDMSIGCSSCRSEGIDTEVNERPHIHDAVKKAIQLLNTSQQRTPSSVYPRISEIFDSTSNNGPEKNSRTYEENEANESLTDTGECTTKEATTNEQSSKTTSRENSDEALTGSSSKLKKTKSNTGVEGDIYVSLEAVMRIILKELGITNAFWTQTSDGRMYQIVFTISFDEAYEELLCELHERGIGERAGSTISVLNCIASKKPTTASGNVSSHEVPIANVVDPTIASNEYLNQNRSGNRSSSRYRKGIWERFMNSVRSRLNIAQIIRLVRQDATIDFDFMILLISAALLSAFGLMDDSLVFLASSMLISPLMGPIIAAIFGTAINDRSLRNMGIRNECYGIMVALIVGFCFGVFVCVFSPHFENMEAVTSEMMYRGALHTLVMCSIAAIPSGAAVAIGILNGNMGSLIGVAISASLLPPAVNSGMLWAMVIFSLRTESNIQAFRIHEKLYFDNTVWDFIAMSGVSMGITVLNILLVFLTGVVVLKVKEIVPGIGGTNRDFWKHDIKIARNISQQNLSPNAAILEELSNLPSEERNAIGINSDMLRSMQAPIEDCQHTWSPGCWNFENTNSMHNGYATVHRLNYLYSTITQQGFSQDFSAEFAGPSRRSTEHENARATERAFKYYISKERERNRPAHRSQPQPQPQHRRNVINTNANIGIDHANGSPVGQVQRFFITPVDNSDQEPDECDV